MDAADREAAEVVGGTKVRDLHPQRRLRVEGGGWDRLDQKIKQRPQILALRFGVKRGGAGLGVGVDDREGDLLLICVEIEEELLNFVHDLSDARVGAVDLVDNEDHRQLRLKRLAQHETGLRQRPFAGVNEQQHAVNHEKAALHLATEVGVARRVDDVQLHAFVRD